MARLFCPTLLITLLSLAMPTFAQTAPPADTPISPKQQMANARLVALWTKVPPHADPRKVFTLQAVQQAIADGADINAKDSYGDTVLMVASESGQTALVQWLLAQGTAKTDLDKAFAYAASDVRIEVMQLLLDHGATVKGSEPCMIQWATIGDVRMVPILVEHGANADARDKHGKTLLMIIAGSYHLLDSEDVATVQLLLTKGVAVNATDDSGTTVLMAACDAGRADVVQLLLDHGANVNAVDAAGNTPLICAASTAGGGGLRPFPDPQNVPSNPEQNTHTKTIQLLLSQGADINAQNEDGLSALMGAIDIEHTGAIPLLLAHGANVAARDKDGNTVLMRAVRGTVYGFDAFPQLMGLLIAHCGNVNAKNHRGQTAIQLAKAVGDTATARMLQAAGAK